MTGRLFTELKKVKLEDFNWLIEQAERYDEARQDAMTLYKQNKRYREALEFYANIRNYEEYENRKLGLIIDVVEDSGEKARQALG